VVVELLLSNLHSMRLNPFWSFLEEGVVMFITLLVSWVRMKYRLVVTPSHHKLTKALDRQVKVVQALRAMELPVSLETVPQVDMEVELPLRLPTEVLEE